MEDLFAPPDQAWHRVSPALATVRRLMLALTTVGTVVVVLVGVRLLSLPAWSVAAVVVPLLLPVVYGWVLVGRNARRWGYAEREEELWITRGALLRRLVVVPYARMQYVDVHSGPVERAFGIASVQLHTASPATSAQIPGLTAKEATRLRDRLTSVGEARATAL